MAFGRKPFTSQPQYPVEIDGSHPSASGLVRCNIANARRDLSLSSVRGQLLTQTTPVPSLKNKIGLPGTSTYPVTYTTGYNLSTNTRQTFLFSGVLPTRQLTGGAATFFRSGTASNQADILDFGWENTLGYYYPRVRIGGTNLFYSPSISNKLAGEHEEVVVALRVIAGVSVDIWWGGVKRLSIGTGASFSTQSVFNWGGAASAGTWYGLRDLQGMWVWDRALSDGELSSLTQNPWQLFRPVSDTTFKFLALSVARPNSDVTVTGWTGSPDNTNLYTNIDETTASDTDYILSPSVSDSPGPAIFGITPSLSAGSYTVKVRARRTGSVGQVRALLVDSSGTTVGTSSWQSLTTTATTYDLAITTTGTAARLRFEVQS